MESGTLSTMLNDLTSQIQRAKTLYEDLCKQCSLDLENGTISNETRNFVQEILTKCRNILDQFIYQKILEYEPQCKMKIYFPILDCIEKFEKSDLLKLVKKLDINFYHFLEDLQPFHVQNQWLLNLQKYSNERHRQLSAISKLENKVLILGNLTSADYIHSVNPRAMFCIFEGVIISDKANFLFCKINNIPIHELEISNQTPISEINPGLKPRQDIGLTFATENKQIDIFWLCQKSINETEKIIAYTFS